MRDLVQEFLAFKTWSLAAEWEMSKMSEKDASDVEPRLVRLRYKCKFKDEYGEPSDEWLDCIEAKCNETVGNYSKPEDKALQRALAARKRHRLNRVFNDIGFFYPDYPNMVWDLKKRKKKVTTRWSKILKVQVESTPQALEEILVNMFFYFWYVGHEFVILISHLKYLFRLYPKLSWQLRFRNFLLWELKRQRLEKLLP
jgi:hypothetical protein